MLQIINIDDYEILIDLKPSGERKTRDAALSRDDLAQKSLEALNNAMSTIKALAHRLVHTVDEINIVERPDEISVEFGLKLITSGGVLVASAGIESQIVVSLMWKSDKRSES